MESLVPKLLALHAPKQLHFGDAVPGLQNDVEVRTIVYDFLMRSAKFCPVQLFRLLTDKSAELANALKTTPICLLDDFSRTFMAKYDDLLADEPMAC